MSKSPAQRVADVLRRKKDNVLRDDMINAGKVATKTGLTNNKAASVLRGMYRGKIDGVDIVIYNEARGNGGKVYRIRSVDDTVTGRVIVDAEMCKHFREELPKVGTLGDMARKTGFSRSQIKHHARGDCAHDIDTPPAQTEGKGPNRYWVRP